MSIEQIKDEIMALRERAADELRKNNAVAPNAYGTGYEAGAVSTLDALMNFIDEEEL